MKSFLALVAMAFLAASSCFAQSLPSGMGNLGDLANSALADEASKALTVENFDPATVNALIDGSSLDDAMKSTLKDGVAKAAENPQMVQAALDQVKAALGL